MLQCCCTEAARSGEVLKWQHARKAANLPALLEEAAPPTLLHPHVIAGNYFTLCIIGEASEEQYLMTCAETCSTWSMTNGPDSAAAAKLLTAQRAYANSQDFRELPMIASIPPAGSAGDKAVKCRVQCHTPRANERVFVTHKAQNLTRTCEMCSSGFCTRVKRRALTLQPVAEGLVATDAHLIA